MLYLLLLFCIPAISQNGNAPRSEQAFKEFFEAMMSSRFTFEKPDREFSLTEDSSGFQNATKKATITATARFLVKGNTVIIVMKFSESFPGAASSSSNTVKPVRGCVNEVESTSRRFDFFSDFLKSFSTSS